MAANIYIITGYPQYEFRNKILYRKSFKVKHKLYKYQYFLERIIKRTIKSGVEGYFLSKYGKSKFYSLTSLKHKLKKQEYANK